MIERIAILHTNDIHSHFENWPKIRRYLNNKRDKLTKAGYKVITVDIGDAIDRAHPLTEATNGQANIELMNQAHYDIATIGNNEGLNNTKNQLNHLYDHANFDVVLDNILDRNTNDIPTWAQSSKKITTNNNTKLRFLGLTAAYNSTYMLKGWQAIPDQKVIPKLLKKYDNKSDILILLSHLGIGHDRRIANNFPNFDIIIGGHSHHLLKHGEICNNSLLAAAQKYGHYVGTIKLKIQDHKIIDKNASVVNTKEIPSVVEDKTEIDNYVLKGRRMLSRQKIAKIPNTIQHNLFGPSQMTDIGLKAIKEKAKANIAIINSGLFLHDLPKGTVNNNQLHEILPHSMNVMKTELSGYNLWRMIKEMEKNKRFLLHYPQKGMGFRGKYFGNLVYSGIKYNINNDQVYVKNQPIKLGKEYTIALLDHYLFIPFFPTIAITGKNKILSDQFLRSVFGQYLSEKYPIEK